MKVEHVIIHELEKEGGTVGATLKLFDSTIDHSDERVEKLIKELNNRYTHRPETYGVFNKTDKTTFQTSFDNFFKHRDKKNFIKFSKEATKDLKSRIDAIAPAKGGYVIFASYEQNRKFVGVFLVRNTTGLTFKADAKNQKFNIDDVKHIDFENLAMACRINLEAYKKKDIRYLSFIHKKSDEMSQYFTRWISSSETETNQEDTQLLFDILNQVELPIDEETGKPFEKNQFLTNVYSSIKSKPGRLINIRSLSEEFFGNRDFLNNHIDNYDLIINGEFKAHPQTLRKFVHIRAKADNIELAFPHNVYKILVRFDARDKNQIIINSEKLANEIRAMVHED